MATNFSRRSLLQFAGIGTLSAAYFGALRAEGWAAAGPIAVPFAHTTPIRVGEAALRVRDLDMMIAFYRDAIGLELIAQDGGRATLAAGGKPLLHLTALPSAPHESRRAAGLFHIAFLMPTREHLARWLVHAAITRTPLTGFADHRVSEAIYLDDPEGNGLEVYGDRAPERWQWDNGLVTMGSEPLDIDAILALTDVQRDTYTGAPAGLAIGHMHLRVGDIPRGRAFYQTALGLDPTIGNREDAAFLSSGGYHHHLAINTWSSAGAGSRSADTTGLDWFSLKVTTDALLAAQRERLANAGAVIDVEGGFAASDPWGTEVRLVRV